MATEEASTDKAAGILRGRASIVDIVAIVLLLGAIGGGLWIHSLADGDFEASALYLIFLAVISTLAFGVLWSLGGILNGLARQIEDGHR